MKRIITCCAVAFTIAACGPMQITTKADPHTATSGTLGSAKFNNQLPAGTRDSTVQHQPVPVAGRDSIPQ